MSLWCSRLRASTIRLSECTWQQWKALQRLMFCANTVNRFDNRSPCVSALWLSSTCFHKRYCPLLCISNVLLSSGHVFCLGKLSRPSSPSYDPHQILNTYDLDQIEANKICQLRCIHFEQARDNAQNKLEFYVSLEISIAAIVN